MSQADKVIIAAEKWLGYLEKKSPLSLSDLTANAGDKNYTIFAQHYKDRWGENYQGQPWCAVYVSDMLYEGCEKEIVKHFAYCPYGVNWFKQQGLWYTSGPKRGDVVFFKDSSGVACHVGLVTAVDGNTITTIEGNTSSEAGVVANGGCVRKKTYSLNYNRILGYGRPAYDGNPYKQSCQEDAKGGKEMSNSALVTCTKLSPNHSGRRNHKIDTITIHHMSGVLTASQCGDIFIPKSRTASSNYGIGNDGSIGLYVDEANRSWCTSSAANDHRAVTIEVSNSKAVYPWPVSDAAYKSLINLLVDICRRNDIPELRWRNDKSLIGQVEKQNMTVHRWFASTDCPGDTLMSKMGQIAADVNARLKGVAPPPAVSIVNYNARVTASNGLNCRSTPVNGSVIMVYKNGASVTITKEQDGWGYTGAGWISLSYVEKLSVNQAVQNNPVTIKEDENMDIKRYKELWGELRKELQDNDQSTWAKEGCDWCIQNGIMTGGSPLADGTPNYMYHDLLTREQMCVMLWRFAKLMGKA